MEKEYNTNTQGDDTSSPLLTPKEAARYIGTTEKTLASWAKTERYGLKQRKLGRRSWYLKSDLDAVLEYRKQNTGTRASRYGVAIKALRERLAVKTGEKLAQ